MKALLLKDWYVLRQSILIYGIICILFQIIPGTGVFISVLYAAILPSSAFAYDDKSRWGVLEVMMPYTLWDIVLSRYVLGILSVVVLNSLGFLIRAVLSVWLPEGLFPVDFSNLLPMVSISAIFMALSLPVFFRFDAEKGRLVRVLLALVICGGIGALLGVTSVWSIANTYVFPMRLLPLAAAVLLALSVPVSAAAWKARSKS